MVILVSCEDEEKVAQSKEQQRKIEALKAELDLKKVKLDANWEKDPTKELEEVEFVIDDLKRKISSLEASLGSVQKAKEKAENGFADYKKRFPINL